MLRTLLGKKAAGSRNRRYSGHEARVALAGRNCVVWTGRELLQRASSRNEALQRELIIRDLPLERGGSLAGAEMAGKDNGLYVREAAS